MHVQHAQMRAAQQPFKGCPVQQREPQPCLIIVRCEQLQYRLSSEQRAALLLPRAVRTAFAAPAAGRLLCNVKRVFYICTVCTISTTASWPIAAMERADQFPGSHTQWLCLQASLPKCATAAPPSPCNMQGGSGVRCSGVAASRAENCMATSSIGSIALAGRARMR
jgi:hypothetical protein